MKGGQATTGQESIRTVRVKKFLRGKLLRPAMTRFCHGKPVWGDRVKDFVSRGGPA
jgi:hypothetical protein